MKTEVQSAVDFLTNLLRKRNVEADKLTKFNTNMSNVLVSHYQDHWFPEKPFKGSAYRCIRIVNRKMDPLVAKAGHLSGVTDTLLLDVLPSELTMWIDPEEVSYRIGEDGSIGVLYEIPKTAPVSSSDFDSSDDSSSAHSGSLSSSPAPQEYYMSFQQHSCRNESVFYRQNIQRSPQPQADPMAHHWGDYIATFVAS